VEDWASWARPFVMGSAGATHVSSSTNINFTRFSFGIGGGVRLYASRHLGFKIQAEWLPVLWTRMWLLFAVRVALFMSAAR
jgi:hypothetical protein